MLRQARSLLRTTTKFIICNRVSRTEVTLMRGKIFIALNVQWNLECEMNARCVMTSQCSNIYHQLKTEYSSQVRVHVCTNTCFMGHEPKQGDIF